MKLDSIKWPFLLLFCTLLTFSANALSPENRLKNPAQETRAMNLFLEVRCLVCNGQVIENSDSEFSYEMRALIRDKIKSGKSDEEIKTELVKKFGEDILVSSRVWSVSLILSLIILVLIPGVFFLRRGLD